jgi:pyruvate-formate lyase
MCRVTFKDIRLKDYNLENLNLLRRLRNGLLATKAEVCIERSKFITKYLRDNPCNENLIGIKYAEAINFFLSNKAPLFFDDNLLAGTTTSKPFGAPVYPEFTGLAIWPELDTISTREKNPLKLSPGDAEILNLDIFPYWMERNILEYTRKKYRAPECMRLFERLVFFIASKAGCISHTVPNYRVALEKGVEYIINEAGSRETKLRNRRNLTEEDKQKLTFYKAIQITLRGVIAYAQNLSQKAYELAGIETDPLEKKKFLRMAEVCKQVPAKPARTFREAVNALWIIQIAIHAENINMAMSPGRLDQILYKYYRQDINKGLLTAMQTMELVGCLWLKFNDNTNLVPEVSEEMFGGAGTVPAVTIGGVGENGEDAVNDLILCSGSPSF